MRGLWKLAAMSAVIGAGLVVVWQAQKSLEANGDPAITRTPDELPSSQDLGPVQPTERVDSESVTNAVNASVPPEIDPFLDLKGNPNVTSAQPSDQPELAPVPDLPAEIPEDNLPESARYTRGLDFRRSPELSQPPTGSDASPFSASAPQRLATTEEAPTLQPVPEIGTDIANDQSEVGPALMDEPVKNIQLTSAEEDADPFANSAPPDLADPKLPSPKPSAANPAAEFDPFGESTTPESKTEPTAEPAADFDPFDTAAPPPAAPAAGNPPKLPVDLDEPAGFDPFPGEPTARPETNPVPSPLPLDIGPDAAPVPNPRDRMPADSDAPNSSLSTPPVRRPPARTPAVDPAKLFRGDGEVTQDAPRGVQEPRLSIEKLAPSQGVLGQPVVYSIVIKNIGNSPAQQVTVEDRIPRGSRLVGTAPQAEMIEKRLVWRKIGTLQPGDERKISIKVIPEEEGPIGSVAKVSFITEIAAEITVFAPQLKLAVTAPSEAKVGQTIPLTFIVSNPGKGNASNVIVRSVLPEGLQHPAGSDIEYTIGSLAPNETREVRLEVTAMKPGRITPTTIVTADGDVSTESKTAVEVIGEQLLLTRSGHDRVYLGRNAVFTNNVKNEGQRPVSQIQVTELVPDGFEFVEASAGGTYSAADRAVNWVIPSLEPGAAATVSVTLAAKTIGRFDGQVAAVGPTGSTAKVKPQVSIEGFPSLSVERVNEERLIGVGEKLTTKIQVQNRGTATAKQVGLEIDLPAEMKLVSAAGPSTYKVDGQRLIFDAVSSIEANGSAAYELVLEAKAAGDSRLEMQISADHLRRPIRHDEPIQVVSDAKPR